MRTVYRVLAWIIAVEVLLQAAAITYAVFGLGKWIQEGGVLDKSVMESEVSAFPEEVGFMVHGINGQMIVPVVAVLLLIVSFFAKVPRGVVLAGTVVGLVALQVVLGMFAHDIPVAGRAARRVRARAVRHGRGRRPPGRAPGRTRRRPGLGRADDHHLTEFPGTFPRRRGGPMLMRRSPGRRLRTALPLLAALVVLGPLGWMWASSFVPSQYSATEMGYVDDGGVPVPGGHDHGDSSGGVPVASLTGDVDGPADVAVTLVARAGAVPPGHGRGGRRATPSTAPRPARPCTSRRASCWRCGWSTSPSPAVPRCTGTGSPCRTPTTVWPA